MTKRKNTAELCFYEIPQGDEVLVLCGETWVKVYGHEATNMHYHNLMEIGICRYGRGVIRFEEETYDYEAGSIVVIPENLSHLIVSDGDQMNFWEFIYVDARYVVEKLFREHTVYQKDVRNALGKMKLIESGEHVGGLRALIDKIIEEAKDKEPFYQKMIEGCVGAFFLEVIRCIPDLLENVENRIKGSNMAQVAAALDFVNKNFSKQIRVKDLSDVCGMSETHFRRIFEAYINMSPMEYVNLIRVQRACELMRKSSDSMDMVARRCGFVTTSTFNRNFKKFLNTSPYQWKLNPDNYDEVLQNFRMSALRGW